MMTTLAALFGALPLAVESGTGAELRFPLGISIIGGLAAEPVADALHHAGDLSGARPGEPRIENAVPPAGPELPLPPVAGAARGDALMASISDPFIRRPVGTTLLAIGLFLIGAVAYEFLPVAVRSQRRFSDRSGFRRRGQAPILRDGGDGGGAAGAAAGRNRRESTRSHRRVRSARPAFSCNSPSAATSTAPRATCRPRSTPRSADLPSDLPSLPTFRKANPAAAPVFDPGADLEDHARERDLRCCRQRDRAAPPGRWRRRSHRQRRRPAGGAHRAQSGALSSMGLRHRRRRNAIVNANAAGPVGSFNGGKRASPSASTADATADEFRMVVKTINGNGRPALDSRRGHADSVRNTQSAAWFNKQPAGADHHQAGRAPMSSTPSIGFALMPELRQWIPAGVDISILTDRTGPFAPACMTCSSRFGRYRGPGDGGGVRVPAPDHADHCRRRFGAAGAGRHLCRPCGSLGSRSTICR
jgi:hypothetical protein